MNGTLFQGCGNFASNHGDDNNSKMAVADHPEFNDVATENDSVVVGLATFKADYDILAAHPDDSSAMGRLDDT